MARKRKAEQSDPQRRGRRSDDSEEAEADPAEQEDAEVMPEVDVNIVDDEDDQGGNQRRENWAALARR